MVSSRETFPSDSAEPFLLCNCNCEEQQYRKWEKQPVPWYLEEWYDDTSELSARLSEQQTLWHSRPAKTHYWQKRNLCFNGSTEAPFVCVCVCWGGRERNWTAVFSVPARLIPNCIWRHNRAEQRVTHTDQTSLCCVFAVEWFIVVGEIENSVSGCFLFILFYWEYPPLSRGSCLHEISYDHLVFFWLLKCYVWRISSIFLTIIIRVYFSVWCWITFFCQWRVLQSSRVSKVNPEKCFVNSETLLSHMNWPIDDPAVWLSLLHAVQQQSGSKLSTLFWQAHTLYFR